MTHLPAPDAARTRPWGIPVTILTGFLGSGKTTLLNHLLGALHGQRLAVIENEFGEVGVDSRILARDTAEEIVETRNGCLCCTVRGDLKRALVDLQKRRSTGELRFDRVVIETSGLAQPAPVVQTLLGDVYLGAHYRLDGVVTLVDARHGADHLDRHPEAQEQVGFADRLVITKPDLSDETARRSLESTLKDLNPRAEIRVARFGAVPAEWILEVGGFSTTGVLDLHPGFPRYARPTVHTPHVDSLVHRARGPFDRDRLEYFLETLIEWYGPDLLRYKGVLAFEDDPRRWILQGVHRQYSLAPGDAWAQDEPRSGTLVFIGVRLPRDMLEQGLGKCEAAAELQ
ncbi:MAG: GTP-binding protein [Burkholderiales bacterium]